MKRIIFSVLTILISIASKAETFASSLLNQDFKCEAVISITTKVNSYKIQIDKFDFHYQVLSGQLTFPNGNHLFLNCAPKTENDIGCYATWGAPAPYYFFEIKKVPQGSDQFDYILGIYTPNPDDPVHVYKEHFKGKCE
jgi:hypothetical protein